jgi:hypothetical protein
MAGPTFSLDSDRRTVTVSFPADLPTEMKLSAGQVEEMLLKLGEFRALMKPAVPAEWPLGQQFRAHRNLRWVTETEAMVGDSVLHLRDPRFGWLHYVFPREMARRLGRLFIAQADALPRGSGSARPN